MAFSLSDIDAEEEWESETGDWDDFEEVQFQPPAQSLDKTIELTHFTRKLEERAREEKFGNERGSTLHALAETLAFEEDSPVSTEIRLVANIIRDYTGLQDILWKVPNIAGDKFRIYSVSSNFSQSSFDNRIGIFVKLIVETGEEYQQLTIKLTAHKDARWLLHEMASLERLQNPTTLSRETKRLNELVRERLSRRLWNFERLMPIPLVPATENASWTSQNPTVVWRPQLAFWNSVEILDYALSFSDTTDLLRMRQVCRGLQCIAERDLASMKNQRDAELLGLVFPLNKDKSVQLLTMKLGRAQLICIQSKNEKNEWKEKWGMLDGFYFNDVVPWGAGFFVDDGYLWPNVVILSRFNARNRELFYHVYELNVTEFIELEESLVNVDSVRVCLTRRMSHKIGGSED